MWCEFKTHFILRGDCTSAAPFERAEQSFRKLCIFCKLKLLVPFNFTYGIWAVAASVYLSIPASYR